MSKSSNSDVGVASERSKHGQLSRSQTPRRRWLARCLAPWELRRRGIGPRANTARTGAMGEDVGGCPPRGHATTGREGDLLAEKRMIGTLEVAVAGLGCNNFCLLYTSLSPRD